MSEFHEVYERHYPDVFRFALFLTGDRSRAEDLAADTFVAPGRRGIAFN
jgi:DNA-directed RNA polymerase specialized sigma24 family protein